MALTPLPCGTLNQTPPKPPKPNPWKILNPLGLPRGWRYLRLDAWRILSVAPPSPEEEASSAGPAATKQKARAKGERPKAQDTLPSPSGAVSKRNTKRCRKESGLGNLKEITFNTKQLYPGRTWWHLLFIIFSYRHLYTWICLRTLEKIKK